jgi:UDP-N-acetyl-D-glucosamine dehydrogenase
MSRGAARTRARSALATRITAALDQPPLADALRAAIDARSARVGVIGLGYVGLPLLEAFGSAGFPVCGFDIDRGKVEALRGGESYIGRVPSSWVKKAVDAGRLEATDDFRGLRRMSAVLVCVPTPLTRTREPDLSYVRETAGEIRRYLDRGQLIVLESTTYPGTTEEVVKPVLEDSGLECGRDFFLAFSPEREDPGNREFTTSTIPKLVGGIEPVSGEVAAHLYRAAVRRVVLVSHAKVAEAAKILENVYRAVNIALVNELKMLFDRMGIDVWDVIAAASTKPFGFQPFHPGPGLGGHCIPIDPFYLTSKAREFDMATRFIELAGEINTQMPAYVVQRTVEALNARGQALNGSRGLVIGVAYKPNTDDVRESPAFRIMELLERGGAVLRFHDPFVARLPPMRHYRVAAGPAPLTPAVLRQVDFVVIVTHHDRIDWPLVVEHAPLVIDTRNATRDVVRGREKIVKA